MAQENPAGNGPADWGEPPDPGGPRGRGAPAWGTPDGPPGTRELTRRQLGLLLAGAGSLLLSGAAYGLVGTAVDLGQRSTATGFGTLRLLRAGRFARLAPDGGESPVTPAVALAMLDGGGPALAAGPGAPGGRVPHAGGHAGHGGGARPGRRWPQPENLTWGDVVLLDVEVRSDRSGPVPFSPGQLRLVPGGTGPGTAPWDASPARALRPGVGVRAWAGYLAPEGALDFAVEYSDPWTGTATRLALPPMTLLEA